MEKYTQESNRNFHEMAYQAHISHPSNVLKAATARSLYEKELQKRLADFLTECHKAGYTQIVIGNGKEAEELWGPRPSGNMVFAIPKIVHPGSSLPLWNLTYILGGSACGNGLSRADQSQLRIDPQYLQSIQGVYNLPEDINKFLPPN
jgi:hypothetical protein